MDYTQAIGERLLQPEYFEVLYGQAVKRGQTAAFEEAQEARYALLWLF